MKAEQELHRVRLEWDRERMALERKVEDLMLNNVNASSTAQQRETLRVQCDSLLAQLQQTRGQLTTVQHEELDARKQIQVRSRLLAAT
jgi:hypothetical protein